LAGPSDEKRDQAVLTFLAIVAVMVALALDGVIR
jgi:hypothetical protein